MSSTELIINQTKKWIVDVVIGCNFCPFAAYPVKKGLVHYAVEGGTSPQAILDTLLNECRRLDSDGGIETTLLILPNAVPVFEHYLLLLDEAERMLKRRKYEGIYQLASFHPQYSFAGVPVDDPANYTNRSVYPMLQLLREASLTLALEKYQHPEEIPVNNVSFARQKGKLHMQALRDACLELRQG